MITLFKVLTKSGRRELAKELLAPYLTPDAVAELAAEGACKLLETGADNMSDERCEQIALGCQKGCSALTHITAAIQPSGEEGKKVSTAEKVAIASDFKGCVSSLLTAEQLEEVAEKAISYIP